MPDQPRIGLLLINLGTPDAPEPGPVRTYLKEFLSDPRVVDIPAIGRWLLLNLFILPFRPKKSAAAYRKIWTEAGSPLLTNHLALAQALQRELGDGVLVAPAMRYGSPSLASGLATLRQAGIDRILILPLYPQYSSAATGSTLEAVFTQAAQLWNVPSLQVMPPFYDDPGFIAAVASQAQPVIADLDPDHVLFSFHGVPERQVRKGDPSGRHCLTATDCCALIGPNNQYCYRAHCVQTARLTAETLGLAEDQWSISFQSRLGRTPWITPFTDVVLDEMAAKGVKRLAVVSPSFTADCLETLEEIGIRALEDFRAKGGDKLVLVPSLNAEPVWVTAVAGMVRHALGQAAPPLAAAESR
jgi:ferrochelatase